MKVILYMAVSVDGYIARENGSTDFVSDREWDNFLETIKKIGNLVVGRRTYEVMKSDKVFRDLDKIEVVIVSQMGVETINPRHRVTSSPKEALSVLRSQGFDVALVGGGSVLNTSFMKENLVDEVYLDEEPIFLGKGIKLFSDEYLGKKLDYIGEKFISSNERQTHWKIVK